MKLKNFLRLCIGIRLIFAMPLVFHAIENNPHMHHNMQIDVTGMVMNSNSNTLPSECKQISQEHNFTVYANVEYATAYPGNTFGYSQYEYTVEPCSRITVTFTNEDQIRHQWMVHGLPHYLYPGGMFHLEAAGGHSQTGSFIVPGLDKTYLVHCDMAQHMEKGMKGQLKVGLGDGDLWAIPGLSADLIKDNYSEQRYLWVVLAAFILIALACIYIHKYHINRISAERGI